MGRNEFEWNRMMAGKLYSPYKVGDDSWGKVHIAQKRFNESEFWRDCSALEELKKCFGKAPDDVVIGSGSVVTKDIPSHVIAAGNPCKVLREITEKDKEKWESQYREYLQESGVN